MKKFKLHVPFPPAGSQPEAIKQLVADRPGKSTLLGVTGSGKTYTMAHVIEQVNKPTLILSPNKTLAAQLYEEFSLFFPENKVSYFVSYYDYYQPESYLPAQDIYIPKETKINAEIERLRIESTASLVNRPDTIVIASVSCIYSLGDPTDYRGLALSLEAGQKITRTQLLEKLIFIQYQRNDIEKSSGTIQVFGNTLEVNLPYQKEKLRIELFGDKLESLEWVDKHNNKVLRQLDNVLIFPAKHFVTTQEKKDRAIKSISQELELCLPQIKSPIYKDRLQRRVAHDLEMIEQVGYCSGIENYSIHFDGRQTGQAPYCLFDFFPEDFLLMIDESHIAIPQLRGMYAGDRSRKKSLIDFGFRLPSAYDNRPLQFEEIEKFFTNTVFVSATPGDYELSQSSKIVQQVIRPTGLLDPKIEIHPRNNQLNHLMDQIKLVKEKNYRTLITVMTKKSAEELAEYLEDRGLKVCYLHCDIKTPQRTELLQKLRLGIFDCLVGVNLLREGLDLPEVALMAIMDADIESFLRDQRSLIQIIGRAARNIHSKVIMYADKVTRSMKAAIDETDRRRKVQEEFNTKHNIIPRSVTREVKQSISTMQKAIASASKSNKSNAKKELNQQQLLAQIVKLEQDMHVAAKAMDFEKAIALRGQWQELSAKLESLINKK
ncbi:excinuclease ABC subunit B [candidate division TM6 bacterium RIFCSPHIGHO2_12_FULL_36_22]|nr:MAG: excinuclease ABC subunit B [candidate division TM6 bacterium RIFCSPHIGHO2_12_FULL_36_22]